MVGHSLASAAVLPVLGELPLTSTGAGPPQAALGDVGLAQRHEGARERLLPVGLEVGQH